MAELEPKALEAAKDAVRGCLAYELRYTDPQIARIASSAVIGYLAALPAEQDSLVERLRAFADDPMWADHAEVPKSLLRQVADALSRPKAAEPAQITCERCQGTGEIIVDWDRYRKPLAGDIGDEAVAPCPDCDGTGRAAPAATPQMEPDDAPRPKFEEVLRRAVLAVRDLDDWANVNETEFTGWGDGGVPPEAEFWRVKSGQALRAILELRGARDIANEPRTYASPHQPDTGMVMALRSAAQAVVDQWDTPNWRLDYPSGTLINKLRAALDAAPPIEPESMPLPERMAQ